ncbi:lytic murein transglycosylase [Siccibacter colletis]|uniref:lytic murein transglycosylase n=1 Tax=Siccibacter colletis TaxID=1505757 RepID=UPI0028BE3D62|nr:lytic murein transglycosylase [Siccibacter colletis]WNN47020.1 lytic murein transglycosylase [Siccibacter colletis]
MKYLAPGLVASTVFFSGLCAAQPAATAPAPEPATTQRLAETGRNPAEFPVYVETLRSKARAAGISDATLTAAFDNIHFVDRVIKSDRGQLENKILLDDYLTRVITPAKVRDARRMAHEHRHTLQRISREYGVQTNYIVALWAMESRFGKIQGKEDIFSALATMAFEGRREAFFTGELIAALKMVDKGEITADQMKGSWAGAMGQNQFMPSSYLRYGADGDGDGRIDIWNNLDDVFASTANYLAEEGWQTGEGWGREVRLPQGFDKTEAGTDSGQGKTVNGWRTAGVTQADGSPLPAIDRQAWIILPEDGQQRAFMVYPNFRTLMHWNRSWYFAISIGTMADAILSD